jgi:hypothetical protein
MAYSADAEISAGGAGGTRTTDETGLTGVRWIVLSMGLLLFVLAVGLIAAWASGWGSIVG